MAPVSVNILLLLPILLPFIASLIIFAFRKKLVGFAGELAAGILIAVIAIIGSMNFRLKTTTSKIFYGFYNSTYGVEYGAPIGVQLRLDSFSSWFMLIINILFVLVLIYESSKMRGKTEGPVYVSLMLFLITGINAVMISNDFFTMVFAWVIIGVSFIILISFRKSIENLREGGMRTYIIAGLSIVFLVLAAILTYGLFGTTSFDYINETILPSGNTRIYNASILIYLIMALTIVGFGLFANIFMLNLWMPKAIEKSPASTQMFSTGIMSGVALISIFRVIYSLFDTQFLAIDNYSIVLTSIGLITAFEGVLLLLYHLTREDKENITLTNIIIYTIITNVGIVLTGLSVGGLVNTGSASFDFTLKECLGYSVLQLINIGLASFLTFVAKDRLMLGRNNSEKLIDLKGIGKEFPITSFILIIGFSSLVGIIPTFGGVNIYMLLFSLIQLDYLFFAIAIIVILVIMLICYLLVLKYLLFDKPTRDTTLLTGVSLSQDITFTNFLGILIACGLLLLGIAPKIISTNIIENAHLFLP